MVRFSSMIVALVGVVSVCSARSAHKDATAGITASHKSFEIAARLRGGGFFFGGHVRWVSHARGDVLEAKNAQQTCGESDQSSQSEQPELSKRHQNMPTCDHGAVPPEASGSDKTTSCSASTRGEFAGRPAETGRTGSLHDEDVQQAFAQLSQTKKSLAARERALVARALQPAKQQL
jgi:hypothetical protein